MELTREDVEDAIFDMMEVAAMPKCSCDMSIAIYDPSVAMYDWWRCKMCFGLVSEARLVEGTAVKLDGTIQ